MSKMWYTRDFGGNKTALPQLTPVAGSILSTCLPQVITIKISYVISLTLILNFSCKRLLKWRGESMYRL